MKKRLLFTMLAAVAVLLSCSKANVSLEDETLFESQTRNESVQNDSIVESGISGTVEPLDRKHIRYFVCNRITEG